MTTLNLTNQQQLATQIQPALVALKNALIARKPVWDKLTPEKRLAWAKSDQDPIMVLARETFIFLDQIYESIRQDPELTT